MQIPAARIYNLPTARMYSLIGQPFGRRSDSPSDDVTDSPSGGPSKLGRSLGQPFGHKDRNYNLSTGLHTYGVIYPAGPRRPELVPAGTQTAFRLYEKLFSCEGEERACKEKHVYESKG